MSAWDARDPGSPRHWGFVQEIHDKGRKHFFRLRFADPIPVDWAVILGEAIHDLRSALDQVVYWLTVDWTRKPLKGSAFPVCTSTATFASARRKIRGIGPGPQAFIEALQPYPQRYRRFYCRDLRTVHDLWNHDKHRLVHLWGLRFRYPNLRLAEPPGGTLHGDRRVLHDGAIVLKALCPTPYPKVKVEGEVGADLAFHSGKRRGGGQESLWDTASTVADIICKLTNAVDQQDRPINLHVWTAKDEPLT
jgi:hypothetical protein